MRAGRRVEGRIQHRNRAARRQNGCGRARDCAWINQLHLRASRDVHRGQRTLKVVCRPVRARRHGKPVQCLLSHAPQEHGPAKAPQGVHVRAAAAGGPGGLVPGNNRYWGERLVCGSGLLQHSYLLSLGKSSGSGALATATTTVVWGANARNFKLPNEELVTGGGGGLAADMGVYVCSGSGDDTAENWLPTHGYFYRRRGASKGKEGPLRGAWGGYRSRARLRDARMSADSRGRAGEQTADRGGI
eukprot:scaffold5357_cov135-Isochrysis_galbana.AAC.3